LITRIVRSVREDIGSVAISMQDTERETSGGTKLTQEAGVALESIFAAVEHQAREIENINLMATQQLQSSSSIVRIMHGVSDTTQQSNIGTRDASQNTERLARLVEQLRSSVEAFKLRENQDYFVPNSDADFSVKEEQDNSMTVSGVFRTISATAQPSQLNNMMLNASSRNSMPDQADDALPFYQMNGASSNSPSNGNNGQFSPDFWPQEEYDNGQRAGNGRANW